jgi:DGQHR domain-containing protein
MTRRKGLEFENAKPGISLNTILSDETYGWKKSNCQKRHCEEWLPERKAFPENHRPSQSKDEGWERKCFDFFEPFFLSGCVDSIRTGQTLGKHGSQIDLLCYFKALDDTYSKQIDFVAICEAKNRDNLAHAYETALMQLFKREFELKQSLDSSIQFVPIVFLRGERCAVDDPTDYQLQDIHKRALKVWENDIDFYTSQAKDLGWKTAWKLFLLEVLGLRYGSDESITLPALRYIIKGKTAFSVFLPATTASRICHVERARKKAPHGVYQRPLDMSRLREIADDLTNEQSLNTCFPNSIVAALDTIVAGKLEKPLWSPLDVGKEMPPDQQIGTLTIPNIYGLLKIIDGQHRVFAHDLLPQEKLAAFGLPFSIMADLKPQEEMILFKSINTTAEEVNSNLVDIILYTMKDHETDRGIASSIICELAFEDDEWVNDIFDHLGTGIPDFDKGKQGIKIKIDNLVQPLIRKVDYELIKDSKKGYLNPESIQDAVTYGRDILKKYYSLLVNRFKRNNYEFWYSYIRTRPGLRLTLLLLSGWIRKKNLRGNPLDELKLDILADTVYSKRNLIRRNFDDTKGATRGDDFLKKIAKEMLS